MLYASAGFVSERQMSRSRSIRRKLSGSHQSMTQVIGILREEYHPDSCHHPKENMIFEKPKARDPIAAASISDLEAEHGKGSASVASTEELHGE
jgi:hypothetical protein